MPLTRGGVVGYDAARMSYKFTMMNGAHVIGCEISGVALSDLSGMRWARSTDRDVQFLKSRDLIEKIASDRFDVAAVKTKTLLIFAKHLPRNKTKLWARDCTGASELRAAADLEKR
jgi:hypothetical protein